MIGCMSMTKFQGEMCFKNKVMTKTKIKKTQMKNGKTMI